MQEVIESYAAQKFLQTGELPPVEIAIKTSTIVSLVLAVLITFYVIFLTLKLSK